MESRATVFAAFAVALIFGLMVWLMFGPVAGAVGFVFIALVALAPRFRRPR